MDGDVRQVREELRELKQGVLALRIEVTDRLARIETNQAAQMAQVAQAQRASVKWAPVGSENANDNTATQSLGKVAAMLVEVTKVALQIVAAVIAALVAVRAGGAP